MDGALQQSEARMKTRCAFFCLMLVSMTPDAFANATATSVNGTVQSQVGTAPARAVRQGDTLRQGDTISTGPASSAVLRFEDGQIAALSANSRMTISTYAYNAQAGSGNVLLSLLSGGMRAVSGLIARRTPQNVAYRAANVTIGIRGTDTDVVVGPAGVVATVNEGSISFALPGQEPVVISAGEAAFARADGAFTRGAVQQIAAQLAQTPAGQQILDALNGLQGLGALLGVPVPSGPGVSTRVGVTPGPPTGSSAGGGGAASAH
jgi:hypothetical protein